jgi:uncharacterized protein
MNAQEQQVIEGLFTRIQQGASQTGPRDPQAEALIQQRLQAFPTAPYYMAQTLVVQEQALQQAEQRIQALEQQAQGRGSFAPPTQSGFQPGAAGRRGAGGWGGGGGFGGGGFLAGAAQMALGIGGGILVAEAATSLAQGIFGGGFGGFGGFDGDEAAFERGYEAGEQNDDQQDSGGDDQSGWGDDGGGGWDGGDFGGGDTNW